jgi:maltooligosyltrehalose trehalohydrolase
VNLDGPDSEEVRRYIIDNALMWLNDYHVDGLRLDAVHAFNDSQATHLLEDIAKRVDALSPHVRRPLSLIAESDLNDPKLITPREAGGYGLTAQWNDDFHHVLHVALTGERDGYYADFGRMSDIAKVLTRGFFHDGTFSSFRGRDHGRPVDTLITPAWRFLGYAQNHDQIGNRAAGDRLTASLSADRLAIAAVLVLTSPFTPMLFMGEEWAASTPWQFFTSHTDQFLADATRQGRVEEFSRMGWNQDLVPDPQALTTFQNSKLDWSELENGDHARLLALHRELAALRRDRAELTDPWFGDIRVEADDDQRWLLIDRSGVRIAINLSDEPRTVPLGGPAGPVLLATKPGAVPVAAGVTLPGATAVVIGPAP